MDDEHEPDWIIDLGSPPALTPDDRARLDAIAAVTDEIGAHFTALKPLTRRAQELVDEGLAAGLSVEAIANHSTIRPRGLQAYVDGKQPLFPLF